jgi:hypothetical protein
MEEKSTQYYPLNSNKSNMKTKIQLLLLLIGLVLSPALAQTAYVTKTGKKYHIETCRYLSSSSIPIDLSDAISKGYGACSVCNPNSNLKSGSTNYGIQKSLQNQTNYPDSQIGQSSRCSATTKAGSQCSRVTKSPNGRCWQHGGS